MQATQIQIQGQSGLAFLDQFCAPVGTTADGLGLAALSSSVPQGRILRVGDRVEKGGCIYKVGKISRRGVVTLNHTCGGFAMFSFVTVCKVVA